MGDAEDIIFGRERSEDTARIEGERREAAKLRDEIATVMPDSIDNLRRHDYVFASQCHIVVTFRGEDRVGWSSHNGHSGDTPCGHDIFILADGSIVNRSGREAREVDLNLLPLSCIKEVWRTTLAMAAYTKRPNRTL